MSESLIRERDRIVERIRGELRALVHERGKSQRHVEQENAFSKGYLSQVLQGQIAMTTRHLFGILLALEIRPQDFFERIFGRADAEHQELRERMERLEAKLDRLAPDAETGDGA